MSKINKKQLEIYILCGLIIILSLYIFLRRDVNLNYKIPNIELANIDSLESITFDNFKIESNGTYWFLPNGYQVSEDVLNTIDRKLKNFEIIDKISERENDQRFGMDNPITLILQDKSGNKTELIIGSVSSSGSYTYIKLPKSKEIYSVRGDITELLSRNPEDLRSKTVLKSNNITKVTITKDGRIIEKDGDTIKDLTFLNTINASNFKDLSRDEELLTLSIIDNESEKSLIVYKDQDGEYPATSSEVDFPFTITKYIVDKLLEIE